MSPVILRGIPVFLALCGTVLCGCHRREKYHTLTGATWNTTYTIKYQGPETLEDSVVGIFRGIEMSLSPFNENSIISRVNRGEDVAIDNRVKRVFEISVRVNQLSGGAFDPTVSPLINLWGFGYDGNETREPSNEEIDSALVSVGIALCHLDGNRLVKKAPGTTFNFSAVTKGYGCDEIGDMFHRNGVENFMIEIGGELVVGGENERGKPWRVMIEAPVEDPDGRRIGMSTVDLTDCGVATSGNYRNYHDTSRGRVGHTISSTTGRPVETSTLSVTVVASTCGFADALATAAMAMPAGDALKMLESIDGVEAQIITKEGVEHTSGFNQMMN